MCWFIYENWAKLYTHQTKPSNLCLLCNQILPDSPLKGVEVAVVAVDIAFQEF